MKPTSLDMNDTSQDKAKSLRQMQTIATGCVAAAFALRIGTAYMPDVTWVGYLRAFSEAAVVGGLADWFAVTALFRHPFGIPIPHTRILPNGKERLAASLSNFVVSNFLNREVVERELAKVDLSAKAAVKLWDTLIMRPSKDEVKLEVRGFEHFNSSTLAHKKPYTSENQKGSNAKYKDYHLVVKGRIDIVPDFRIVIG